MIKKFLIGTFAVAALALALTVSAAYDFGTTTLRVGSKGAAVMSVQTLVGAKADGSFGPLTAAKVKVWQAANGLTADGVFGAKSKAVAMAGSSTGPVVQGSCPSGYVATTPVAPLFASCVAATPVQGSCPTGYGAITPVAPTFAACAALGASTPVVSTGATDGSLTLSDSSYISSNATIKKGETKDIAGVRLQAISGPVKVSYVDVQLSVRPWLFFNKLVLRDNNGTILATKDILSAADSTEIAIGTKYQVRFDGLNYTVTPGTNVDLAVSATVLASTDKIVETQAVTSGITSMRTVSEMGYSNTVSWTTTNQVTLTASGSVAILYTRLSPSSPLAGQQVVSLTSTTNDVTLGVFSLKSTNNTSSLNTFKVTLVGSTVTDFSNYRLFLDGVSIAGGSLSGSVVTFNNLNVPLGLDTWKDFTVKADIKANPVSTSVSATLSETGVAVTDANYGSAIITAGTRTSGVLTLTTNSVVLSGVLATLGAAIVQGNNTAGYNATYAFTLTNSSNNDLYVSATLANFLAMTITGTGTASNSALTNLTVSSPSTAAGDVAGVSYAIPSGTARSFSFAATIRGDVGTSTTFAANLIDYGTASGTPTDAAGITTGLTALKLTASF